MRATWNHKPSLIKTENTMGKYKDARVQANRDIRAALRNEGKLFINISVKQLQIITIQRYEEGKI